MENEVINDYQSSLVDLTCNSKPLINMLTMLAEENEQYASHIVEVIETHINQADEKKKLPSLYLIDSIVKNLPKTTYPSLFSHNIASVFSGMFEKVDEKTRQCMFKVRQTWNEIFPNRKLYAIDVRVNLVDPAWPITAQPPVENSIHVNPKFLSSKQQKEEEILDDDDLIIHDTVTEEQEALMRQQLIAKQQELLKLQQQRLELELKETKAKLDQQKQINVGKLSQPEVQELTVGPLEKLDLPTLSTSKPATETTKPPVTTSAPSRPTTRDPRLASRDPRSGSRDPRLKGKSIADPRMPPVSKPESSPTVAENSELASVPTSVPTSMVVPTSLMAYPPPPVPNMMPPTGMMPPGMVPGYMPPVMNMQPQTTLISPAGGAGRPVMLPGMLPFPMPTARMGIPVPPPHVVNVNNQAIPKNDTPVSKSSNDKSTHDKSNSKVSKSSSSQHLSQKSSTDHKSKDVKDSSRSSRDTRADRKHSDKRDSSSTSAKSGRHSDSKRSSVEKDRDQKDNKDTKERKSSSSSSRRDSPRSSYSNSKEEKAKTRSDSKSESKSKKSDKDDSTRHKRSSRDSDEDSKKSNRSDDSDDRKRENTRSTRSSKARTRSRSPVKSKSPESKKSKSKSKEKSDKTDKTDKKSTKEESKKSSTKNSKKMEKEVKEKTVETEISEAVKIKEEPVEVDTNDSLPVNVEQIQEIKVEKLEEPVVEPSGQDVPKVAAVEEMDVDDRQTQPPQALESLKREHEDKKVKSDASEEGPSSSKKPRLEEETELGSANVMDEDISSLFGSEDQDYRSQRDVSGPPLKSPFHDKWMKFRENHPGDFKYELDLQKGRDLAAHDVDHRRTSSEPDPLNDVDHRHEAFPQDIDLRSSTARKSLDQDARDFDSRHHAKPVHIPAALQLDHREEILEQIEQRRRSGDLSHDMHQELLHQLSRLDNVQRQQDRLGYSNNPQGSTSPIHDTDRRGRDAWQYRSPLKDPPQSRPYDGRPDFQRTNRYRDGPLKDFDNRHGPDRNFERRRTPPIDHPGPLRDRNPRDIDNRHGPDFDDRRRLPHNIDGPNRDFDNRHGPPRDYDRRHEHPMDNRPPRDWQGPDDRLRSGPGRDRDWNYNENEGRGWHNRGRWKDNPGFREDGPPGRYHDHRPRYNYDEHGPPDGPHGRNGPFNERGPHMGPLRHEGPLHRDPFIKRQQSTDPRWRRIVGYNGPDENEEFVIDGRPYGIAVGQPARKIRVAGRTIEVFADPNERAIRVDGAIVYRFGDMVREMNIGRVTLKIFYHGLPSSVWIDGIMRELRVDAPPKIINIKDKEHTIRIDGRDLMILIDNKEVGVVGGPPRYTFIDNNRCEFRFDPPPRKILIDGTMCELKLDRAIPCIVINNKKRGIRFDGPPREIIVDNINYLVPVDDCVKIRINNKPHYLAFGGPAHEVILDGKWFEVKFDGPAKEISLGNRLIYVRLEGPPPEVKILDEIIDETESVPMRHEGAHPMQNGPHGPGQPQVMMMGGPMEPQPLMPGMIQPGQVMMNSMQQQPVMATPGQPAYSGVMPQNQMVPTQIPGMMPAVSGAVSTGFPNQAPAQQAPGNQVNIDSLLQRLMAAGIIPAKDSGEKKDTNETSEPPKPPEIQTSKNVNPKAVKKDNFIKPVFKQVKIKEVPDLTELKTDKLKQLHEGVIQCLFSGIQCSACGQRFSAQQTERYREHLDWHFRQNRRDKDDAKVTKYRRWYYDVSDWITYEEIDESEDKGRSNVFEKMIATANAPSAPSIPQETVVNVPEGSAIIHCPPATGEEKGDVCEICGDPFEQFWNEDQEEWHLRDAIRVENKTYHPICYEDEKEGSILEPTPTPIKAPLENPLTKQIKEEANPIILQIRQELGELPISAIDMSKVKVNKTKLFVPEDDEEQPAPAAEEEGSVQERDSEEDEAERDSVMKIIKSVVKTEPMSVKTESGL